MADNSPVKPIRKRADGRKALLVYLDENLIKSLKKIAVDDDCNAYDIVEAATRKWIDDREAAGKQKKAKHE